MAGERTGRYERIYEQLRGLIEGKAPDLVAAMATICAVTHAKMPHHLWTGFYRVAGDELHVGPYEGPVACQVLRGGGVCLRAAETRDAVIVPNVAAFAGHIACDARARSEIAIPVLKSGRTAAVFDVDSTTPGQFTVDDVAPFQRILELLAPYL
ncbi:MAG: GAF domain-containing protein [Candidatus Bipolaricaulia bacterium]